MARQSAGHRQQSLWRSPDARCVPATAARCRQMCVPGQKCVASPQSQGCFGFDPEGPVCTGIPEGFRVNIEEQTEYCTRVWWCGAAVLAFYAPSLLFFSANKWSRRWRSPLALSSPADSLATCASLPTEPQQLPGRGAVRQQPGRQPGGSVAVVPQLPALLAHRPLRLCM